MDNSPFLSYIHMFIPLYAVFMPGIVGSNPTQGMDICIVCVYSVFVFSCVYATALRRADPPSKESYWLCIGSGNWKSGQGPTKGCRAIIIQFFIIYMPSQGQLQTRRSVNTGNYNMDKHNIKSKTN
jgi:hypothetical protein